MSWDILFRKALFAALADSATERRRFSSLFVSCSSFTIWLLRCTLSILRNASTISSAKAEMMSVSVRMVEFIMFMVLTATEAAGISSISVMS